MQAANLDLANPVTRQPDHNHLVELTQRSMGSECTSLDLNRMRRFAPLVSPEIVQQVVELWTIRDGLLAERRSFPTRADALDAAGLPG